MFVRKDNNIIWSRVLLGGFITAILVGVGILWADKILYSLFTSHNCWSLSNGWLCSVALIFGKIFSPKIWLVTSALSVLFFFIYKAIRNEFDFRYAFVKIKNSYVFYVFCSVVLAFITTGFLKVLIGRSRPFVLGNPYFAPWNFESVVHSMPSGHTTISFAALIMIGMLFPRIKWATWTLAIAIGLSRIYVCAHWGSDVVLGAFVGMLCADIVKSWLKKINTK